MRAWELSGLCALCLGTVSAAEASVVQLQMSRVHLEFTKETATAPGAAFCNTNQGIPCDSSSEDPITVKVLVDGVDSYRDVITGGRMALNFQLPFGTDSAVDQTAALSMTALNRFDVLIESIEGPTRLISTHADGTVTFINQASKGQGPDRVQGHGLTTGLLISSFLTPLPPLELPLHWSFDLEETSCTAAACFYVGTAEMSYGLVDVPPDPDPLAVPAPGTLQGLLAGLIGLAVTRRRRKPSDRATSRDKPLLE